MKSMFLRAIVLNSLVGLLVTTDARAANSLMVNQFGSDPPHEDPAVTGRRREKGRKGIKVLMQYVNDSGIPQPCVAAGLAVPCIEVAAATVSLTINGTPLPTGCALNVLSPAPGACGFVRASFGVSGDVDTVKVYYNDNFPAGATVQVTVSGVTAFDGTAQDAINNTVKFKVGPLPARDTASIELVFDISGSMGWPTVPPSGTVTRLAALKDAARFFFEIAGANAMLGDRLGVSFFSTNATPTPGGALQPAHDPSVLSALATSVQSQTPTAATSIGAGLAQANNSVNGLGADTNPRKFVLLFSDGDQNTPPLVASAGTPGSLQVGGSPYPTGIKVCPITAGRSSLTAPGFILQRDIAAAACPGSGHLHIDAAQQNFIQTQFNAFFAQVSNDAFFGDKLEVARDASGTVGFTTPRVERFFANARDTAMNILLSWTGPKNLERGLQIRLTAPDGTLVDIDPYTRRNGSMRFTSLNFPLRQGAAFVDPKGEWKVDVVHLDPGQPDVSYHLMAISDNETLASDYGVETTDIGTGEPIPLRVTLTEAGVPVTGATVTAELVGPNHGLGDALGKATTPSGTPAASGDLVGSAAKAKLALLLQDPAFVAQLGSQGLPTVTLTHAGAGVYRGHYDGAVDEGHYQFQVKVRGSTATNGTFERSRRLTVFVRPKPDPGRTDLLAVSSIVQADGSKLVTLRATPRDRFDNLLGPDYPPHLNIQSSEGTVATPLADRLDGSYEIVYRLPSATSNPEITLVVLGQTVIKEPLDNLPTRPHRRPYLSLHLGFTSPFGTFGNTADGSLSLGADLEIPLTSHFSVEAYVGHDRFEGTAGTGDPSFTLLSARGRLRSGGTALRTSAFVGAGPYFDADGNVSLGVEAGVALEWWITNRVAVEGGFTYRSVDGGNFKYGVAQVGGRFRF